VACQQGRERRAEHIDVRVAEDAGSALIVPAGEEFALVAEDGPAEAVCIMTVGGQAITDGATFTPPWAE
jgi:hypothetical protein